MRGNMSFGLLCFVYVCVCVYVVYVCVCVYVVYVCVCVYVVYVCVCVYVVYCSVYYNNDEVVSHTSRPETWLFSI